MKDRKQEIKRPPSIEDLADMVRNSPHESTKQIGAYLAATHPAFKDKYGEPDFDKIASFIVRATSDQSKTKVTTRREGGINILGKNFFGTEITTYDFGEE